MSKLLGPYIESDRSLVVGDCHVAPDQMTKKGMSRFKLLNHFIDDVVPNRLVMMGDFVTMDSLSAWDMNKRKRMELRRYRRDIAAGNRALDIMLDGGVANYTNLVYLMGNHELRVDRYLDSDPTFDGQIDLVKDLNLVDRGFTIIPYKEFFTYRGMSFTHVPIQENGKPVQGKYATQRALDITTNSVCFGHTHKLDVACVHRHGAKHLQQAINVGCFFEHVDDYAKGSVTSYWRGVVLLDHYDTSRADITAVSLGNLRRMYK